MKGSTISLLVVLGVFLLFAFWGCNAYNGFVSGEQGVKEAWSNVETNYQRRTDLYASVIKTVEASANFEKSTLNSVVQARAAATQVKIDINDPATLQAYQQAQANLQGSFSRLIASFEQYPDLKTTKEFQDFQTQIEGTENRINVARQDYNKAVKSFNLSVKRFPGNLLAGLFGFSEKAYYEADKGTEKAPDINFNIQ
ncbi:MAG: LemA family protein [Sphingomonadales bacterium]|nr:LemA family protein [Sphingomonadales bacterium]